MKTWALLMAFLGVSAYACLAQGGQIDRSFGNNGTAVAAINGHYGEIAKTLLKPDGRIMVVGSGHDHNVNQLLLFRFDANGIPDSTFNGTGQKVVSIPGFDYVHAMDVQLAADGGIFICGMVSTTNNGYENPMVLKLDSLGNFDNGFGQNGISQINVPNRTGKLFAMALQNDGKIVATGRIYGVGSLTIRMLPNGTLDNTFSSDGFDTVRLNSFNDFALDIAIQPDGKMVLAGSTFMQTGRDNIFAMRYNTDGTLDAGFNGSGLITFDFGSGDDGATAVAIQADGKIVLGGYVRNTDDNDMALWRLNANGTLDSSFGTNALVLHEKYRGERGSDLLIMPDGKIILAATVDTAFGNNVGAFRVNSNGSPDNTFGKNGLATVKYPFTTTYTRSIIMQPDGKLLLTAIADSVSYSGYGNFHIIRLHPEAFVGVPTIEQNVLKMSVYPNPTVAHQVNLTFTLNEPSQATVYIADILGQQQPIWEGTLIKGSQHLPLYLPETLTPGTYWIQLQLHNGQTNTLPITVW